MRQLTDSVFVYSASWYGAGQVFFQERALLLLFMPHFADTSENLRLEKFMNI